MGLQVFRQTDTDGNGQITREEFLVALQRRAPRPRPAFRPPVAASPRSRKSSRRRGAGARVPRCSPGLSRREPLIPASVPLRPGCVRTVRRSGVRVRFAGSSVWEGRL